MEQTASSSFHVTVIVPGELPSQVRKVLRTFSGSTIHTLNSSRIGKNLRIHLVVSDARSREELERTARSIGKKAEAHVVLIA